MTALDMVPLTLENASVVLNGEKIAIPFTLAAGEYAELEDGEWTRYTALGAALERKPAARMPMLRKGGNSVDFDAADTARANISFFALSNTRPAFVDDLTDDMRRTMRYEGMMPFAYAPAKGLLPPAAIPVRPGEKADISFEIYGPAKNPSFTFPRFFGFSKSAITFPVEVKAGQRLVCRDRKAWRLENSKDGKLVKDGVLEEPLPTLGGTTAFGFAAEVPDGATCAVDILKSYQ